MVARRGFGWLVSVLLLLAAPREVRAQADAPEPARLGEIVVSAEAPVSELAATTRRVTGEDIEAYGARTLDEAIALLPGVYVRTGSDGTPRIDLRGFRTRQVVLLLDGVPLNATSDGQFDPTLVPVEQIAEIKLVTGTGSVLYGPAGLAGSINIVTRSGGGPAAGTARGEWQDGSAWLGRLTGSGGSGRVSGFASASGTSVDGVPSVRRSPTLGDSDSRLRVNSRRERLNLGGHLGVELGGRGRAGVTLQAVSGEYGVPPSVIDDPADPFANRPVYERVEELDGLAAQLAGSFVPADQWSVRGWVYRNLLNQLTDRYADSTFDGSSVLTAAGTSRDRSRSLLAAPRSPGDDGASAGRLTLGLTADRARGSRISPRR
jgi:outer membrane receptor protein involved in Fe transport